MGALLYPNHLQMLTDHTLLIARNASTLLASPHLTPSGSQELYILLVKSPQGPARQVSVKQVQDAVL